MFGFRMKGSKTTVRCALVIVILCCTTMGVGAQSAAELQAPAETSQPTMMIDPVTVHLAVLKGPTGFGYVKLLEEPTIPAYGVTIDTQIFASPNEVLAKIISGELDMAALPMNAAAVLYNKGIPVRVAAITGEGTLSVIMTGDAAEDARGRTVVEMLNGRTVSVPGAGSTPDLMAKYLLDDSGLVAGSDVVLDYSIASPAQLAQFVIAGKSEVAILPEPFTTMVAMKRSDMQVVIDVQQEWEKATGMASYPMTALVVREPFATAHPEAYHAVRAAVAASIEWVNADPASAAQSIEKFEILTAALAQKSIPSCALSYTRGDEAVDFVNGYLSAMFALDPASIGGSIPDEAFYVTP